STYSTNREGAVIRTITCKMIFAPRGTAISGKLSQNPKNAEKSAIFMVAKGQLLTKLMARYVGGHATQALSLRCHRCPMGSDQAVSPHAGSHGPPPRR